ncbi:hypothetical protein, partial [Aneurinibacillus danicus]|uniref:hypothetical protein n=1 Tax=Aneurinibacillus danicus TaxID=267746 RepID=UPI001C3FA0DA
AQSSFTVQFSRDFITLSLIISDFYILSNSTSESNTFFKNFRVVFLRKLMRYFSSDKKEYITYRNAASIPY